MIDIVGILAGLFVILAFYATDPVKLRQRAIVSNLLFIAYAAPFGLWPIVVLHMVLLPLNWTRLAELQAMRGRKDQTLHMTDSEREVFVQGLKSNSHCWAIYGRQRLPSRTLL
ncbi:MAG: hypothetical protein AAGA97_03345 [Pseudomonadota bacterium]